MNDDYVPDIATSWRPAYQRGGHDEMAELVLIERQRRRYAAPWLFAADTLLPIVNLGQDGYWRLTGALQWIAGALVAAGWILATTAAVGAARALEGV